MIEATPGCRCLPLRVPLCAAARLGFGVLDERDGFGWHLVFHDPGALTTRRDEHQPGDEHKEHANHVSEETTVRPTNA